MEKGTVERASVPRTPSNGGEMESLIRSYNWAATPLGALETWPQRIQAAVQLMLDMPQPVCLWWGEGPRLLYNDEYRIILTGKHPHALGQTFDEVWPELVGVVPHPLDAVRAHGARRLVDWEFSLDADGERRSRWFTASWTPIRDESGAVIGAFNASTQTTDRVLAERALRESQENFRSIANVVPDLLWNSEPDGATTWYNTRWTDYTGQTVEQAVGWGWIDVIHPDDREASVRGYREAVRLGEPFRREHRIRRHDGEYRWFLVRAEPQCDESGRLVRMYGAAADIHEERIAREQTERFFSSVSHELQTPMTAIRAGLGLLDAAIGGTLGPAEHELLQASRRNAERLRLEIGELLAANDMVAGGREVDRSVVDLRVLVEEALGGVRPLLQEKQQTVAVDVPDCLEVVGDRRLLERAVANLLSNACRHTPPGTHIAVSGLFVGEDVRLAVNDTGPGIPPDELERIFQRFHRASGSAWEGIGLGLAITRDAVEAQGGRVWAESVPGQGTTFFVSLPQARMLGAP